MYDEAGRQGGAAAGFDPYGRPIPQAQPFQPFVPLAQPSSYGQGYDSYGQPAPSFQPTPSFGQPGPSFQPQGPSSLRGGGGYGGQPGYGAQGAPFGGAQAPFGGGGAQGGFGGMDPFVTGLASNVLQQSGANYFQRGQAYVQSRMGFLSVGLLHYHFNINSEYVRSKLFMLLAPFLKSWTYMRVPEQIAGGHKYLPPRQDVNAPDLYIPFMAFCTYCLVTSFAKLQQESFQPEGMYSTVSSAFGGWVAHLAVLKGVLWSLGIPSALPYYELLSYAGYTFVPTALTMGAALLLGVWGYRGMALYGAATVGIFLVRTFKRVVFVETRQYSAEARLTNYVLLLLWSMEFVFVLYFGSPPKAK